MCCTYKIATFILLSEIILIKNVIPFLPLSAIFAFLRTTNAFHDRTLHLHFFPPIDKNPILLHS